jgi:hypothetical protein
MNIRIFPLSLVSIFLFAGLMLVPCPAGAAQAKDITQEVMSGADSNSASAYSVENNELQVTNPDKKKELQIKLGDQFKAYILAAASPFKELNGKPMPGNFRAMFGFHIPLK